MPKRKRRKKKKNIILTKNQITKKIVSLINSDSNENWIQVFHLMKKTIPKNIKTFDSLDLYFELEKYYIYSNDFFYDLEAELHSEGLDDLNRMVKRAEVAQWIYKQFSEEEELNLGNFRNYEAESLWEIGKIEEAKRCFEKLIQTFPNFAYGYIIYGDQYWMSNWSYQYGADYERAEKIYRMAFQNPELDLYGDVEDRIDELSEEKNNPEERTRIAKIRLKRIHERKKLR